MIISNLTNDRINYIDYEFEPSLGVAMLYKASLITLPEVNCKETFRIVKHRYRNQQSRQLFDSLEHALSPCAHQQWLISRGITNTDHIYSINNGRLSRQELLDLVIYPDDHILDAHGERIVEGPTFLDKRNGKIVGVCIRNASTDLEFVKDAKYTFSNYGWFLFGYDLYDNDDDVIVVEGVFDALALRHFGLKAIAVGSCHPSIFQLACLKHKFKSLTVCFDNDIHGHYGAYYTARILDVGVLLPKLKDVSCYFEMGIGLEIAPIEPEELYSLIEIEAADYNYDISLGHVPTRQLPYN